MGFSEKLKGLREQAQQAVGEHREQIEGAVHGIGEVANRRTHGKYADKISRFDSKATEAVGKFGGADGGDQAMTTNAPVAEAADGPPNAAAAPAPTPMAEPPAFD